MATFTTELKNLFSEEDLEVAVSEAANAGLDSYPIWDDAYRNVLNEKIIGRYWNREIGFETVQMFRFQIRRKMGEIMPYYNKLYASMQLDFDPLSTIDIRTIGDNSTNSKERGTNTANSVVNSGARSVSSITPQTQLSGNGDYADSMTDNNSETANTSSANTTGESEQHANLSSHTKGFQGSPADLIVKYRESLINVDLMVLDELSTYFMLITDAGDEFFSTGGFYSGTPYSS